MKRQLTRGFTLIELLVVITIIAILAAFAVPAVTGAIKRAQQSGAVSNCRQILISMQTWGGDFNGVFPDMTNADQKTRATVDEYPDPGDGATSTSNFQALINYGSMTSESIFYVAQDRDATGKRLVQPDDDLKTTPLETENNGWSYMRGLDSGMPAGVPLIFTQTEGTEGVWPAKGQGATKAGGCWDGKVVVGRVGGDVIGENLTNEGKVEKNGSDQFDIATYGLDTSAGIEITKP